MNNKTRQKLENICKIRNEMKAVQDEKYKDSSKRRLNTIINKKGKTLIFGIISRIEKAFGELWGHGLSEKDKNESQLMWDEIWDACRTECLNHAHGQLRSIDKELEEYDIKWLRHNLQLILKTKDKENDNC